MRLPDLRGRPSSCSSPTCSDPASRRTAGASPRKAELRKLAQRSGRVRLLRRRGLPRVLLEPPRPHLPAEPGPLGLSCRAAVAPVLARRRPARTPSASRQPPRHGRRAATASAGTASRARLLLALAPGAASWSACCSCWPSPASAYLFTQVPLPGRGPAAAADHVHLRGRRHQPAATPTTPSPSCQRRRGPGRRHLRPDPAGARSTRCSPPRTATSSSTAASTPSASPGRCGPNLRNEGVQQGGSTITQQYVKNVYLTHERTVTRKLKEAALAVKLERELPEGGDPRRATSTPSTSGGAPTACRPRRRPTSARTSSELDAARGRLPGRADPLARDRRRPAAARRPAAPQPTCDTGHRRRTLGARRHAARGLHHPGRSTTRPTTAPWDDVLARAGSANNFGSVAHPELGHRVLRRLRAPLAGDVGRVHRRRDLRRRPAGLHDARLRHAAGRRRRGHRRRSNRPDDPAAALVSIDDQGRGAGDGRRPRLRPTSQVNLAVGTEGGGSGRQPGSSFKPFVLAEALKQGIAARRRSTTRRPR